MYVATQILFSIIILFELIHGENGTQSSVNETNVMPMNVTNNSTIKLHPRVCIGIGQMTVECNGAAVEDALNSGGCLAGDGLIQLSSGIYKRVSGLQAGDRVRAMSDRFPNHIIEADVIMIMHRASDEYGM